VTVVDTSAIMAILLSEPDAAVYAGALEQAPLAISAGNLVEAAVVLLHKKGPDALADLFELIELAGIVIAPVSEFDARAAIDAYRRYGRSSGHQARLNFGDCFAYALARSLDRALLYKGDDFAHTDIASALTA
jgi:ribonuclease VapC